MRMVRCAPFRSGDRLSRPAVRVAGLALAIALLGCDPLESYRSMKGISKNDPDPQTAPFTGNMAEAQSADYPNLATVPPPPTRATTTAEREKLTERLTSEGASVHANTTATPPGPIVAPPMPPPPVLPVGPKPVAASLADAAPTPEPGSATEAAPAAVADASASSKSPGKNQPESGRRKQGEPPEPAPQNSNIQTPELAALPDPETVRPPPAPPSLAAAPPPSAAAPLQPPAAAVAAGKPQPAPSPPPVAMPPPPPPPAIDKSRPQPAAANATLASIALAGNSTELGVNDRELIERIAVLYKEKADTLRVIGYASAPSAGADPLDSYRAALDRAQAVAKILGGAGMPANRVQPEATPGAGAGNGRVEIQLVPMTTAGPAQ
jgi:hypothetical protein